MTKLILTSLIVAFTGSVWAAGRPEATKPKYKKGKQENFDAQVVEGQVYRPDLSVVTGDTSLGGFGALKLRNDFVDHVAAEAGSEEAQ